MFEDHLHKQYRPILFEKIRNIGPFHFSIQIITHPPQQNFVVRYRLGAISPSSPLNLIPPAAKLPAPDRRHNGPSILQYGALPGLRFS